MYQSDSFYLSWQKQENVFFPNVITAFNIFADENYYHYIEDEEHGYYPENTFSFIRCFAGEGEISLYDKVFRLRENECLFLRFHTIKKYTSITKMWGYKWVNFTAKNASSLFETETVYSKCVFDGEEQLFSKFLQTGQSENVNVGYVNTVFNHYLYSVMLQEGFSRSEEKKSVTTIDEICGYIRQKIYSKISIGEISSFFQMSPRRMHQIFTQKLGISPKRYILNKKLEEGYKLLVQTTIPINEISAMLCFSSPYHFSAEFKKTFNGTPTEVRKMENIQQIILSRLNISDFYIFISH